MADSEKQVSYGVSADASAFEQGMGRAAESARGFAGQVDQNFRKVQDAFATVQKQLLVLAGIVAGGAFFKAAIDQSNQLTGETMKLSKALGINAEEAGTLHTALQDIGSSGDEYVDVFTKFARQLKSNEDGLRALGLQTRDANGNIRESKTLFTEALQSVGQYKAGLDQNTYAQTIFGKSISEVMTLQKLNNQVLEEAQRKNRELGLIVTKENVEASKAYKLAMNDVGDVLLAVKKTVGDAVMPVFTELGQYLASTGPYVVEVFKGALLGLLVVFETIKAAVKAVAVVIFEAINQAGDIIGLLGEMFVKLVKADYQGVYEAGQKIGQRLKQGFANAAAGMADAVKDGASAVGKHFERIYGDKVAAPAPTGGSKRMGEMGKEKPRTSEWDAELAEAKLAFQEQQNAAGTFYTFSKQQELAFWKDKLALTQTGSAENLAVRKKTAELELSINQDKYAHEIASLATQEAAYKQNIAARIGLMDQEAALVKQRFGQESKEYEEVQKRITEAKRQAVEQQKQIDVMRADSARNAQLTELQIAQQQAESERDLHMISTADLLTLEAQYEARRYDIELQGLKDREEIALADPDRNPVELERLHEAVEAAEERHQLRLSEIKGQAAREQGKYTTDMYQSIEQGWARVISQAVQGGLTLAGFFRAMMQTVVQAVVGALAQMAAEWLAKTILQKVLSKTTAAGEIADNAAVAGAGAYAATAVIPYVGPFLAPAAATTAFAGAMAFQAGLASAAGGYDIPGSINPIVQTHANEMILPAKHADVIRRMSDQDQNAGSGKSSDVNVTINATPMGRDFFMVHRPQLVQALKSARRDNAV